MQVVSILLVVLYVNSFTYISFKPRTAGLFTLMTVRSSFIKMYHLAILIHIQVITIHHCFNIPMLTSPPDDPPTILQVLQGLQVLPYIVLALSHHMHNSETLVTQRGMAPASLIKRTTSASKSGTMSRLIHSPAVCRSPAKWT